MFYLGGFFIGEIIWGITGNGHIGVILGPIISATLAYVLYGLGWYIFWLSQKSDKWIYTKILFAWIPLVAYLIYFRPHTLDPAPMQLVNMSNQFVFSTVVTATLLFPLYSLWLNRYVLIAEPVNTSLKRSGFIVLISMAAIVYLLAWHLMALIYK